MSLKAVDPLAGGDVPNLDVAAVRADCHEVAALRPRHRRHRVAIRGEIAEARDLARAGGPQVNAGAEADAKHVLRGPVHKVEVKVVLKFRGVQDL